MGNPTFTNFPTDRLIRCNESPEPVNTGRPEASDACAGVVTPTFTDITRQEPDERLCPGDTIITRTWTVVDDCGNVATRDQTITITLPVGQCIPTACPLCAVTILPCPFPTLSQFLFLSPFQVPPTLFPCPCPFPCHSQLVPLLWLLLLLASPSTSMFSMTMRTPPLSRNQLILVLPKPRIAPLFCLFPSSSWHFLLF